MNRPKSVPPQAECPISEPELSRLIERARQRDPEAFDRLIDVYASRLHGYLFRLTGSRHDAEDLLQELFLRVVRTIQAYEHNGRFEGWLFRIATNLARDRMRQVARSPLITGGATETWHGSGGNSQGGAAWAESREAAPDAALIGRDDADALQAALSRLSAAEREVVMLRHFSELTFAEISETMGTPLGTTLARGHRALQKLRAWLSEPCPEAPARPGMGDAAS